MNAIHLSSRARLLAAVSCICALLHPAAARGQTGSAGDPLPPPAVAPESRLTVNPAEFEQWLAGSRPGTVPLDKPEPDGAAPSLVTPPPPTLARPPPPPPTLDTPAPPGPAMGLPPAPELKTPEEPRVATLPPEPPATVRPPAAPLARPDKARILYPEGIMDLPEAAKPGLDKIVAWLRQNPAVRVQIVGYASDSNQAESQARRISLYRTLAVRKYLVENGILSTRLDVRALGSKTDEIPRDRVDISLSPS